MLLLGAMVNGVVPVVLPVTETFRYALELFRNTQNPPTSPDTVDGVDTVLNDPLVML